MRVIRVLGEKGAPLGSNEGLLSLGGTAPGGVNLRLLLAQVDTGRAHACQLTLQLRDSNVQEITIHM